MQKPEHKSYPRPGQGQVFLGTEAAPPIAPRHEQLQFIYRLSDPALSDMALLQLLDELLARVVDILDVDTAAVLLVDRDADELVATAARGLEEEVEQGVRIPIGQGFAGRIARERLPIFIADVDHADILNPILRKKNIQSLLGVPLTEQGEVLGVLHVGTLSPRSFTNEDAAVLQMAAARAAPAIDRAALFDALEREHRAAAALQRSLLPERLPDLIDIPVAARYLPARDEVGGDWYDVIELPQGSIGIAIGDVVGHGARAAALMGQLRAGLRAYAIEGYEPSDVMERSDRLLRSVRGRGMATAVYGVFDPETSTFTFCSAGHPPPLVKPSSGPALFAESSSGVPLGAVSLSRYEQVELKLEPDALLLLYTDGLVENRHENLERGFERLLEAVTATTVEALCTEVVSRLAPRGGAEDDIALVALKNSHPNDVFSVQLRADALVLASLRRALRRWLRAQDVPSDDVELLTLAVGEAAANAIEHAYTPDGASFAVEGRHEGDRITLEIRDSGTWRPARGNNRGRGLSIIEQVMDDFSIASEPTGTRVIMRRRLSPVP